MKSVTLYVLANKGIQCLFKIKIINYNIRYLKVKNTFDFNRSFTDLTKYEPM